MPKDWAKIRRPRAANSPVGSALQGHRTDLRLSKTYNLLARFPKIASEWHPTKNGELKPEKFTHGSSVVVWWLCHKKHAYKISIYKKVRGYQCSICREENRQNNLLHNFKEEWASEWNVDLNLPTRKSEVSKGSSEPKYWWDCPNGHEPYLQSAQNRSHGHGCPICGTESAAEKRRGIPVNPSFTIENVAPHLILQWNTEKNSVELNPKDIAAGSGQSVWWKCAFGHEWPATIASRALGGNNCPSCSNRTSLPEITLYYELKTIFESVLGGGGGYRLKKFTIVDILIEDIALVIEYDGKQWHAGRQKRDKDKRKSERIKKLGFNVMRVRERPLRALSKQDVIVSVGMDLKLLVNTVLETILEYQKLTSMLTKRINKYLEEDLLLSSDKIWEMVAQLPAPPYEKSLEFLFPGIASEWSNKNDPITPRMVTHGSKRKVLWCCSTCSHEWPATINNRTSHSSKCPRCEPRASKQIQFRGVTYSTRKEAADQFGISPGALKNRLRSGWSLEKALTTPLRNR